MRRKAWIAALLGVAASLAIIGAVSAAAPPPDVSGLGIDGTVAALARTVAGDFPAVLAAEEPPISGVRLIESSADGVVLELVTTEFAIETVGAGDDACDAIVLPGATSASAAGWPDLPGRIALVGVPARAEITLEMIAIEIVDMPRQYDVCPVPEPVLFDAERGGVAEAGVRLVRDTNSYATEGFAPESPTEIVLAGFIRSQRVAQVRFHPFQYDPTNGRLRHVRRIRVRVDFGRVESAEPASEGTVDEGAFERVLGELLLNHEDARGFRVPRAPATPRAVPAAEGEPAYKILVDRDGLYELTCADLYAAGIPTDTLDPRTLQVANQGQEIGIHFEGEADGSCDAGDTLLFFGQGVDTRFTITNVYWLSWGAGAGVRMPTVDGAPQGRPSPSYFNTTARAEDNTTYESGAPSGPDNDRWYWQFLGAGEPTTWTYSIDLMVASPGPFTATMSGLLQGYYADPQHHTLVLLNGHTVSDATWASEGAFLFQETVPYTYLLEGPNEISIVAALDMGITDDYFLTNWFEIEYGQRYEAIDDQLFFGAEISGTWDLRVTGFQTATVDVLDVTDPLSPTRVLGVESMPVSDTHTITFAASIDGARAYLAIPPGRRLKPLAIMPDDPSDLRALTNGADYIIVTHGDFVTAATGLADYHTGRGLRTTVVDVQDAYDEFGGGIFSPEAIHDFLAYAYANWEAPPPSYVLLLGDGHYDFLDHLGTGEVNWVPPYLADVDPWIGETVADNRYVSVSGGDDLPDMYLGRIPVRTPAEVVAAVAKITQYDQGAAGEAWRRRTVCVADESGEDDFAGACEDLDEYRLPPPYTQEEIYHSLTHAEEQMPAAIVGAINEGRLLVGYSGHASLQRWSGDKVFQVSDIAALTNTEHFPVMLPMACLEGYYIRPSTAGTDWSSLSESIVRAPAKGAVASFAPTGYGLPSGHHRMIGEFYDLVFVEGVTELGPATTLAKLSLVGTTHEYMIDNFVLMGDPALSLDVLRSSVIITKAVEPSGWVYPGETLTYTIAFSNGGPDLAHATIVDDLPLGLVDAVATSSGTPITMQAGTRFAWVVPELAPGAGGTITITAVISRSFSGPLTNTTTIAATTLDADLLDNQATVVTTVPYAIYLPLSQRAF